MSQVDFATYLEDNAALFTDPKGADMLELIRNLEGHANVSINQAVKLQTGAIKLTFTEEVELQGWEHRRPGRFDGTAARSSTSPSRHSKREPPFALQAAPALPHRQPERDQLLVRRPSTCTKSCATSARPSPTRSRRKCRPFRSSSNRPYQPTPGRRDEHRRPLPQSHFIP